MSGYKTIKRAAEDAFIEKKSRFIGNVCPAKDAAEAIAFIDSIRAKYPDATHNVYAYVVRKDNQERYSDAGEPQGTAGIPVLDTIKKQGLTDVAVVVTRYFGGTLLGAGGLVRAYAHAASIGLSAGEPCRMLPAAEYLLTTDYPMLQKLEYVLSNLSVTIENTEYAENVKLSVCVECSLEEEFLKTVEESTNARVTAEKTGERFVAFDL